MTLYHIVHLVHEWHMTKLRPYEKKFVKDMKEAVQGMGINPSDHELIENCGITQGQIKFLREIGKRFLIH